MRCARDLPAGERAKVGSPAHGSPLSHVFLRNLHRRQARSFLISLARLRCSGSSGPRRLPTFFSVVPSFLLLDASFGLQLWKLWLWGSSGGPEFLRAGGEVEQAPAGGVGRVEGSVFLMGMGAARQRRGSRISGVWLCSPAAQLRWLLRGSTYVSDSGE